MTTESSPRRGVARKLLLSAVVLLLACGLAEVGARVYVRYVADDQAFLRFATTEQLKARLGSRARFQTHRHLGHIPTPGFRGGNDPASWDRHNTFGFRGSDFPWQKPANTKRIVCCGASTTYGWGTRHTILASFPVLLEQELNRGRAADAGRIDVINAGVPGWTTLETLINFETRVLDLEPDVVLYYHGMNPVLARMVWPAAAFRSDLSGWLTREEHVRTAPLLEWSALYRIAMVSAGKMEPHGSIMRIIGDLPPSNRHFEFHRQRSSGQYPAGPFKDASVDTILAANGTKYFERNLRSFVTLAKSRGIGVLLGTFAFSKKFPERPFMGHPAVQAAIEAQNDVVRRVAAEMKVDLIDVAKCLPDDRALYTDGFHFTDKGNRVRALGYAEKIRACYPFARKE